MRLVLVALWAGLVLAGFVGFGGGVVPCLGLSEASLAACRDAYRAAHPVETLLANPIIWIVVFVIGFVPIELLSRLLLRDRDHRA